MKKTYVAPIVLVLTNEELGEAYYGAMASSCCTGGQRCRLARLRTDVIAVDNLRDSFIL